MRGAKGCDSRFSPPALPEQVVPVAHVRQGEDFCITLYVDSIPAPEHVDGDGDSNPVHIHDELGGGGEADPCDLHPTECGGADECAGP